MRSTLISAAFVALAACGGGDDGITLIIDADTRIDAPQRMAAEVPCNGVNAPNVMTIGSMYSPMSQSVAPAAVVLFDMPAAHNAVSDDGLFDADFGVDTCVRFDTVGTYAFHCSVHSFTGSIVVEIQ